MRGAVFGLTRDSSAAHIVRAALEGVAHQVADLFADPAFEPVTVLRIDGGMSENRLFCQILANLLGLRVERAANAEASAFGVAALASLGVDPTRSLETLRQELKAGFGAGESFSSQIACSEQDALRSAWKEAISRL